MPRPRKTGPRTRCGRLSRAYKGPARDTGTPEVQAKRALLAGDGDPALSATAPGTLFANGHLDQQQYDAAMRYRSLHAALFGTPWPRPSWGGEINDQALTDMQSEFDSKAHRLSCEQKAVITDVCVFDHRPHWFFAQRLGLYELPEDQRDRLLLIEGLDAILERRRSRAA